MASDRVMVSRSKIRRIVSAIQEMTQEYDGLTLDEMPDAIRSIGSGGGGAGGMFVLKSVRLINKDLIGVNVYAGENGLLITDDNLLQ